MLILSQDKSRIFNFNTITDVNVEYINGDYELRTSFVGEKGSFNMGEYDTEERAKEVLQEIIEAYSKEDFYHIRKSELNNLDSLEEPKFIIKPVIRTKVYEMPEK